VKDYEKWDFRFVSEYGMQSYNSPATQARFSPARDRNVFGAAMETHQKNKGGNQVILDYVSRRYRFPKDQDSLIYLSQLNQAHCVQTGASHYRRLMPRCMGSLYWQLNDCWPVASWSSIEFTGRWRALHFAARRFYAPAAVSALVPGDEIFGISNYRKSTVRLVHVYTSFDGTTPSTGVVRWDLFHLDGRRISAGRRRVALRPMQSVLQKTLDLSGPISAFGRENLYLRVALDVGQRRVSEETAFLTLPRFMDLPTGKTNTRIKIKAPDRADIYFRSTVFQHRFSFDVVGHDYRASDNYFDLHPGETKRIELEFADSVGLAELKRSIAHFSLVDSY
jgi:beta-mannosidase